MIILKAISFLVIFFVPSIALGQLVDIDEDHKTNISISKLDSLSNIYNKKIKQLENLIYDIKDKIDKKDQENQLKKLLEEANQLSSKEKKEKTNVSKKFHSGTRKQQGLNPNISLGGDFFSGYSSESEDFINEYNDFSYGNNRFEMREVEVALVAPLDPFTRGKTFISVTKDGISIEEAYMEWLNLPLNMNLKTGIFYADFGILNRWHDHALPQFDRPKVLANMFSNLGLGGFGFSSNFLLPRMFFADASSFDLSIVRGGNNVSFTGEGDYNIQYIGKFKNYYDLNRSTYLEFVLSGVTGYNDPAEEYRSYIGGLGTTCRWTPVGREKYRTIDWKTEFLFSRRETFLGDIDSWGFYSSLQYKLNSRYWWSGRIGYSEIPVDNTQSEWDFTTNLDFWQSEFVFMRLQYQYSKRDMINIRNFIGKLPSNGSLILQVSWAMGPHKHETY